MVTPPGRSGSNQYRTRGAAAQAGRAEVAEAREGVHALAEPARFRDTDGFDAAVALASENLDISASAVVKDYWVTQALRAASVANPGLLFKGGTSFSKAWQIITRFSEDIDLVLADPDDKIGRTQRGKAMKGVVEDERVVCPRNRARNVGEQLRTRPPTWNEGRAGGQRCLPKSPSEPFGRHHMEWCLRKGMA